MVLSMVVGSVKIIKNREKFIYKRGIGKLNKVLLLLADTTLQVVIVSQSPLPLGFQILDSVLEGA